MRKMHHQFYCSQFLLPEHQQELEKYRRAQKEEINCPPTVDEQEKERWDALLCASREKGTVLCITVFSQGKRREICGRVKRADVSRGQLYVETSPEGDSGENETLLLRHIISIQER